jgi:ribonucleotide monophosphatase NagD (HAD superfamily)
LQWFLKKWGAKSHTLANHIPEVYNQSIDNKNKKVLCIGDNLNTDIKGANLLNYDSLLISNGVHKKEIENNGLDVVSKNYEAICNFTQSELKW